MATAENLSRPTHEQEATKKPELKTIEGGKKDTAQTNQERIQKILKEAQANRTETPKPPVLDTAKLRKKMDIMKEADKYSLTQEQFSDLMGDLYVEFGDDPETLKEKIFELETTTKIIDNPNEDLNTKPESESEEIDTEGLLKEGINQYQLEKALLDKEENEMFKALQESLQRGEITEGSLDRMYTQALANREARKIESGEIDLKEADKTVSKFDKGTIVLEDAIKKREAQLKTEAIGNMYEKVQEASESGQLEFGAKELHESRQKLMADRKEFENKYGVAPEKMGFWKKSKMRIKDAEGYYEMKAAMQDINEQTTEYNAKVEGINDTLGASIRGEAHQELEETGRIEKPDYDSLPIGESELYGQGVDSRLDSIEEQTQELNKVYADIIKGNVSRKEGLDKALDIEQNLDNNNKDVEALVRNRTREIEEMVRTSDLADHANKENLIDFDGDELWDSRQEMLSLKAKLFEKSGGIDPDKPGTLGTIKNWLKTDKETRNAYKEAKTKYGNFENTLLELMDKPEIAEAANKTFAEQRKTRGDTYEELGDDDIEFMEDAEKTRKQAEVKERADKLEAEIRAEILKLGKNLSTKEAIEGLANILKTAQNSEANESKNPIAPIDTFKINLKDKGDVEFYLANNKDGKYGIIAKEGATLKDADKILRSAQEITKGNTISAEAPVSTEPKSPEAPLSPSANNETESDQSETPPGERPNV